MGGPLVLSYDGRAGGLFDGAWLRAKRREGRAGRSMERPARPSRSPHHRFTQRPVGPHGPPGSGLTPLFNHRGAALGRRRR